MSSKSEKEKTIEVEEDIKFGLTKKQRSWIYTGIFFAVVLILFVVNNTNGVPEKGPYPPHYQEAETQLLNISDLKGKVVILDFWATWCAPCRKGIPDLLELKEKYKDEEFEIVGISLDAITRGGMTANDVIPFIEAYNINYPIVKGTESSIYAFGNINTIPTSFILDKNGMIIEKHQGLVPKQTYINVINSIFDGSYNSKDASPAPELGFQIINSK
ncbi:MAG: TlpA disulfide reductase family protein [Bacteroidota bacterium]